MGHPLRLHHWQRMVVKEDGPLVFDDFQDAEMDAGVLKSVLDYGPYTRSGSHDLSVEESFDGEAGDQALYLGGDSSRTSIFITADLPRTVTLATVGDFIQMDFIFTTAGDPQGNRCLRYGFCEGAASDLDAMGYAFLSRNQGGNNRNCSVGGPMPGSHFYDLARPSNTSPDSGDPTQTLDLPVAGMCRVERLANDEVKITGSVGDHELAYTYDGASPVFDLDQVWFGIQRRSTDFVVNNLEITTNA